MLQTKKIESFTPEQEARIPEFLEKWIKVCSESLDKEEATQTVNVLYKRMGESEPKILFAQSPLQASLMIIAGSRDQLGGQLRGQLRGQLGGQLWDQLRDQLGDQLWDQLGGQLWDQLGGQLRGQLRDQLGDQLWGQLGGQLGDQIYNRQEPEWFIPWAAWFDFASHIGVNFEEEKYDLFLRFCSKCGWVFPFKGLAIVSERPTAIHWDSERRLHAEGKLAVEFADGWGVYAHHGVRLPEKYGSLLPSLWQPQWLLEEENAELRRVLIEGIGYERICSELQAESLDTWREYELLRIDNADIEPILLAKMTCPSTGFVHVHRVPPESRTAREAITWVNHGVDPESFLVEQ
jgi:hypothetical protein